MKKHPSLWSGLLLGLASALALVALSFLGDRVADLPLIPYDIFDWLARVLPGGLITLAIDSIVRIIQTFNLGDTSGSAKVIEQLMAGGFVVGFGAVAGLVVAWIAQRAPHRALVAGLGAGVAGLAISWLAGGSLGFRADPLLSVAWLAVLWLGWGALLGTWLQRAARADTTDGEERRTILKLAGGSLVAALLFGGVSRVLGPASSPSQSTAPPDTGGTSPDEALEIPATSADSATLWEEATSDEALATRAEPVPGTRPELTSTEEFYRIDINTRPVQVDPAEWELVVDGLFDNTGTLTLGQLRAYPAVIQPLTLSCISNRVGGDLIGTTRWTGLHLRDLLADLGLQPEAQVLRIEGADGFYEYVEMEDMMDARTLLVYEMNGEPLPVEHGFPLRIYIPNRYGMKQPKWITRIEAVAEWEPGYWVTRGWSRDARPQIVSVIDAINPNDLVDGQVPVGGIAWAGDRGIEKVEVQVDTGEWQEADLLAPPLSPLTWVLWRYEWDAEPGRRTVRVRATDGTGTVQTAQVQGVRPDGATGYHEQRIDI